MGGTHKQAEERILHDAEEFYIRKAKPSEQEKLHEIFRGYYNVIWWYPHKNALSLVAIDKKTGRLIGGIEREVDKEECCAEGAGLAVLPDFQKRGVGASLVHAIDNELEKMGIKNIKTVASSEGSWKIFRKQGYHYTPAEEWELKMKGVPKDKFVEPVEMFKEFGREPATEVFHRHKAEK
jgi:N-acetylglutamate synthase-like GNAT family acetyltransferase